MKQTAIRRVTIELSSGAQIVMAPSYPSLPAQFVMPDHSGRIGKVLEIAVDDLLEILAGIKDSAQTVSVTQEHK